MWNQTLFVHMHIRWPSLFSLPGELLFTLQDPIHLSSHRVFICHGYLFPSTTLLSLAYVKPSPPKSFVERSLLSFSRHSPLWPLQEWSCDQSLVNWCIQYPYPCDLFRMGISLNPPNESALGFLWDYRENGVAELEYCKASCHPSGRAWEES